MALITTAFTASQAQVKIDLLGIDAKDEKLSALVDNLKCLSVEEALHYCAALQNKINGHLNKRTMDWTVASLDIELL